MVPEAGMFLHSGLPERPFPERRLKVRHKVHSPAYATRDHHSSFILPHLNEIVDIGEDGMCFQNLSPLEPRENLKLCLDLSETNAHIEADGEVVWAHDSGRTGVRFHKISKESTQQLRQWLFINIIIACVNHASSVANRGAEVGALVEQEEAPRLLLDHSSSLIAVAAIEKEVGAIHTGTDSVLQIIADRALKLTRASGAAIALSGDENMICRASSGSDAPPVGAILKTGSGFSGECVRTGELLCCEDSETDSRVDRESCKVLGVCSMIAAPIRVRGSVHGILEVFSPQAHAFTESDKQILQRLADIISTTVAREAFGVNEIRDALSEPAVEADETTGSSRLTRFLAALVAAVAIILLALIVIPRVRSKTHVSQVASSNTLPAARSASLPNNLEGLTRMAEQGDTAAQFDLGIRYATGDNVKQDYSDAAHWFLLAADRGDARAQSVLAAYYWEGTGVAKDLGKAYFWAILARANQDEPGRVRAAELATRLTYTQRAAIEQQADEWVRQHSGHLSSSQ